MDLESAGEVRNRAGRRASTLLGHRGEPVAAAPLSHWPPQPAWEDCQKRWRQPRTGSYSSKHTFCLSHKHVRFHILVRTLNSHMLFPASYLNHQKWMPNSNHNLNVTSAVKPYFEPQTCLQICELSILSRQVTVGPYKYSGPRNTFKQVYTRHTHTHTLLWNSQPQKHVHWQTNQRRECTHKNTKTNQRNKCSLDFWGCFYSLSYNTV